MNYLKIFKLCYRFSIFIFFLVICYFVFSNIYKLKINFFTGMQGVIFIISMFFGYYLLFKKIVCKKFYIFDFINIIFLSFLFTFILSNKSYISYKFIGFAEISSKKELELLLDDYLKLNKIKIEDCLKEYLINSIDSKVILNFKLKIFNNINLDYITLNDYLYFYSLNNLLQCICFILIFFYFLMFCYVYLYKKKQINDFLNVLKQNQFEHKKIFLQEKYDIFLIKISNFYDFFLVKENIFSSNEYYFKKQYEINLPLKIELLDKLAIDDNFIDYKFINILFNSENEDIVDVIFKFNKYLLNLKNQYNVYFVYTYEAISTCNVNNILISTYDILLCVDSKYSDCILNNIQSFLNSITLGVKIFVMNNAINYFNRNIFYSSINKSCSYIHVGSSFYFFYYTFKLYKFYIIGNYIFETIGNQSCLLYNLNYIILNKLCYCMLSIIKYFIYINVLNYYFEKEINNLFLGKFNFLFIKICKFFKFCIYLDYNKYNNNYNIYFKISTIHFYFKKIKYLLDNNIIISNVFIINICTRMCSLCEEIKNLNTNLVIDISSEEYYIFNVIHYFKKNINDNYLLFNNQQTEKLEVGANNLFFNIRLKNKL